MRYLNQGCWVALFNRFLPTCLVEPIPDFQKNVSYSLWHQKIIQLTKVWKWGVDSNFVWPFPVGSCLISLFVELFIFPFKRSIFFWACWLHFVFFCACWLHFVLILGRVAFGIILLFWSFDFVVRFWIIFGKSNICFVDSLLVLLNNILRWVCSICFSFGIHIGCWVIFLCQFSNQFHILLDLTFLWPKWIHIACRQQ